MNRSLCGAILVAWVFFAAGCVFRPPFNPPGYSGIGDAARSTGDASSEQSFEEQDGGPSSTVDVVPPSDFCDVASGDGGLDADRDGAGCMDASADGDGEDADRLDGGSGEASSDVTPGG